ncbi:unnamed protein product [Cladocopium goreaui]|uniref:Uncharacterized protein n=1 Tax=Cladocopium goreaui TaxID=2562237 RepID=A0A9P1D4B2_9DINO|nr:unnamed protein product [Cladocopium goreaui]
MRRTVMRFAQKTSQRHGERLDSSSGFPDAAQWALTVGLGTLIPGFALFKLFTVTGAVEAEKGAGSTPKTPGSCLCCASATWTA